MKSHCKNGHAVVSENTYSYDGYLRCTCRLDEKKRNDTGKENQGLVSLGKLHSKKSLSGRIEKVRTRARPKRHDKKHHRVDTASLYDLFQMASLEASASRNC